MRYQDGAGPNGWVASTDDNNVIWTAASSNEICDSGCIIIEGGHSSDNEFIQNNWPTSGYWDIEIEYDIGFLNHDANDVVQVQSYCNSVIAHQTLKEYTGSSLNSVILKNERYSVYDTTCYDASNMWIFLRSSQSSTAERVSFDAFKIWGKPLTPSPTNKPTNNPTNSPTFDPTMIPTLQPTTSPTNHCTDLIGVESNDGRDIVNGSIPKTLNRNISEKYVGINYYDNPGWKTLINCSLDDNVCLIKCSDRVSCGESMVEVLGKRNMSEVVMVGSGNYGGFYRDFVNISDSDIGNLSIICQDVGSCALLNIHVADSMINYINIVCEIKDSCFELSINLNGVKTELISIYCMDVFSCSPFILMQLILMQISQFIVWRIIHVML